MRTAKIMLAATAVSMIAAPVLAAPANPAASLSVAKSARVGAPGKKTNALSGGVGIVAAILAAGIIAIPVIQIVKDEDDDSDSN